MRDPDLHIVVDCLQVEQNMDVEMNPELLCSDVVVSHMEIHVFLSGIARTSEWRFWNNECQDFLFAKLHPTNGHFGWITFDIVLNL